MTTEITPRGQRLLALFVTPWLATRAATPATFALREYVAALRRARAFLLDTSRPEAARIELANVWTRAAWELWAHREALLARQRPPVSQKGVPGTEAKTTEPEGPKPPPSR